MNTHELAWAAGFFDGEGHIGASKKRRDIYLNISQVDRRVLDRFREAVGVGTVHGPYDRSRRPNERNIYLFQAQRFERIQAIIAMLWRYLSPVKRDQAATVLLIARGGKPGHSRPPISLRKASAWQTCLRGHPRSPENTRTEMVTGYRGKVYQARRCVACLRERTVTYKRQAQMAEALLMA